MHQELGHFTRAKTRGQDVVVQRTGGGIPGDTTLQPPIVVDTVPAAESPGPLSMARGQQDQGNVVGDSEIAGRVPSRTIEYQRGVSSWGDMTRDFLEMELHRLGVREG